MNKSAVKIIAGIVGAVIGYVVISHFQFGADPAHFDNVLVNTANELNKNLPMMIDRDTRWDTSVAEPENQFIYVYTITSHVKSDLDATKLKNELQPQIIANYKTSDQMKVFREHNVTLHYQYKDKNGEFVFEIVVTPKNF